MYGNGRLEVLHLKSWPASNTLFVQQSVGMNLSHSLFYIFIKTKLQGISSQSKDLKMTPLFYSSQSLIYFIGL